MSNLASTFKKLKTAVSGNRQRVRFERTYSRTPEEMGGFTPPQNFQIRLLSELEFLIHLSEAHNGCYDELIGKALDELLAEVQTEGILTRKACEDAETLLMPLAPAAKEYKIILAAHAHIDMNWKWSYTETVAITLATFRTMLNIMDQYPEFCFSQSQASVYKIVEEHDPEMMEEIKARIREGRWEVTATAWVETDKNMPSGESLLRHIEYTREYLSKVWGVTRFDLDFSPDTFGHSANIPEINTFGDVKYYYHCRGNDTDQMLYRYRARSGKEILVHKEQNWYNSGITPHIGIQAPKISAHSSGLKTSLIVYGVGDHGGGPTRRDVERALDMMTWPLFPKMTFGTMHSYFDEAATIWEKLPVRTEEMNVIFPGCYTTQSRIKRGNRRTEAALMDAEHLTALANHFTGFPYAKKQMTEAWQHVLFTHFHDILTGSCVQDSREYAMGLYQTSKATANTQIQNALRKLSLAIDTSSIPVDEDRFSQSEGAGVGFGTENFIGVPSPERGGGRTRIFHVFNPLPWERTEQVELTVWDWTGELKNVQMKKTDGTPIPFQVLDRELTQYWAHHYFRVLATVRVPALGYTTIVLSEEELDPCPVYLFSKNAVLATIVDDFVLENEFLRARIDHKSGRILSLIDKVSGAEQLPDGQSAGFTYIETEPDPMSSWNIGRYQREFPVDRCVELQEVQSGPLRQSVKAVYQVADSSIEVVYQLDQGSPVVQMSATIDWREHGKGKTVIPVLSYQVPLSYTPAAYQYDIPAGAIRRKALHADVPAQKYGMAISPSNEKGIILLSDCKYGYRGADDTLALTLINSATNPDPYPERGIHTITLWLGVIAADEKAAGELALRCDHPLIAQSSNCHTGTLPLEHSLLTVSASSSLLSTVLPTEDGSILVRLYEVGGKQDMVTLTFADEVKHAEVVDLFDRPKEQQVTCSTNQVHVTVEPYALTAVKVTFSK